MKKLFLLLLCSYLQLGFSQTTTTSPKGLQITYAKTFNGKPVENEDPVIVFTNERQTLITTRDTYSNKKSYPYEVILTQHQRNNTTKQISRLRDSLTITYTDSLSLPKQSFEISADTKIILGYKCHKAKTIVNSNTIELWFTQYENLKAAPSLLGQHLGIVLQVVRNGNYITTATSIRKMKNVNPISLIRGSDTAKEVDLLTYQDLLWKSRFTTIPIFRQQTINFSGESQSDQNTMRFANGTIIVKKVKFPVIANGSRIFADVTEQSNGDAYDRTGSVFLIPTDGTISFLDGLKNGIQALPVYDNGNGKHYQGVARTAAYSPLLELMRFFTPFGVKQYNYLKYKNKVWQDSVIYRQDISELSAALNGKEVYIGMTIGNYDKGGHKASLNITIHSEQENKTPYNWVLPLFNSTNVMEMAGQEYGTMFSSEKGLEVTFNLDRDSKNTQLRYITTGHGGWENGDEYLQKKNTIILDGKEAFSFIPWRTDCGSYRLSNPASGNFGNGLSSSDYSRSNWCPGTTTNPILIDLGDMKAGQHTLRVKIPLGPTEGGSFSSWNVSGVLIGE